VEALHAEPFNLVGTVLPNGRPSTSHMSLSDSSGDSAIFEYVRNGTLTIYHSRSYTVSWRRQRWVLMVVTLLLLGTMAPPPGWPPPPLQICPAHTSDTGPNVHPKATCRHTRRS
jgi:hypothetical protein